MSLVTRVLPSVSFNNLFFQHHLNFFVVENDRLREPNRTPRAVIGRLRQRRLSHVYSTRAVREAARNWPSRPPRPSRSATQRPSDSVALGSAQPQQHRGIATLAVGCMGTRGGRLGHKSGHCRAIAGPSAPSQTGSCTSPGLRGGLPLSIAPCWPQGSPAR